MTKHKTQKRKVDVMTSAVFLFAAVVMMFIGVVGTAFIGKSYAVGAAALPTTLTVHTDSTFGGKVEAPGLILIRDSENTPVVFLTDDFYGTDASGTRYELYCLESKKGMPNDGTYTKDGDLTSQFTDLGIVYIVTNSYPNNNSFMPGVSREYKKAVTQFAIWYYQDLAKGTPTNVDGELDAVEKQAILNDKVYGSTIVDIANKALQAKNTGEVVDTLSVDKSQITYRISSDGKYFESNYIPVVANNNQFRSYKVTLGQNNVGAELINEQGAVVPNGSTFGTTSKFKIRVSIDKLKELNNIDLTATVTGSFEHKQVFAYRHSSGVAQTALVAAFDNVNKDANLDLHFNIPTGPVEISKQDITNSKELPGATLVITDCNGQEVAKWVSTDKPHYIEALPITTDTCKYKLTETIAPEGYEINSESIEFEVKDDGTVTKVVMKDNPLTPTPDTGMNIPMVVYVAGGIILICGIAIIYASVKPKKED